MTRLLKLASAALIALTLFGGAAYAPSIASNTSTPMAMQQPMCDRDPDCYDDVESAYKKGSFDITETESSADALAWSWGDSNSG
jgi:hypothetical protein